MDHHTASQSDPLYDVREQRWIDEWVPEVAGTWRCHGWCGRRTSSAR